MQLRYMVLLCCVGLFGAWNCQGVLLAYVTIFGCAVLYGLRRIDYRIGDLQGRGAPGVPYTRPIRRHIPGVTPLQPIFAGDLTVPGNACQWELQVSLTAPSYLDRPVIELSMRRQSGGRHASRYPTDAETEAFLANPPPYIPSQFWIVDRHKIHRDAWSADPDKELLLDLQRGVILRACRRPEYAESTDNAVRPHVATKKLRRLSLPAIAAPAPQPSPYQLQKKCIPLREHKRQAHASSASRARRQFR
jgi:hypothetical protein